MLEQRKGVRLHCSDAKGRINSYSITASPIQPGVTGTNYYYTDQTGVIRHKATAAAAVGFSAFTDPRQISKTNLVWRHADQQEFEVLFA